MTKLLSESQLAEIKAREEAATPEPWEAEAVSTWRLNGCIQLKAVDAKFIANARTDIPALLAHIESLSAELKEANFILEGLRK